MLDQALDALYTTPPERFTRVRAEWAARLRGRDAVALRRRRRPSRDAFALNLLARAERLDRLARLGQKLATALKRRDGAALRAAMAEERDLIDALAERALALAAEKDVAADRRAVAAALRAAVADKAVAAELAEGRLERAPTAASFPGLHAPAGRG